MTPPGPGMDQAKARLQAAQPRVELANKTQEALNLLLGSVERFPEWVATLAFYKALYVADVLLIGLFDDRATDHGERRRLLSRKIGGDLYKHYAALDRASQVARYLSVAISGTMKSYSSFAQYFPLDKIHSELIGYRLRDLEVEACSLFPAMAGKFSFAAPDASK